MELHSSATVISSSPARRPSTIFYTGGFGLLALMLIIYTLARWVSSQSFRPTPAGRDVLPLPLQTLYLWTQIASPLVFLAFIYFWLVKPWVRRGRPSIEGLLTIGWATAFFQDPIMSLFYNTLSYNANMINFGAWANGSFPIWLARNTQFLAEPIVMGPVAYVVASLAAARVLCALLDRMIPRTSGASNLKIIVYAYLMAVAFDFVWENAMIHAQFYAYPGTIKALSFWSGTQYQFPIYESLFFGANIAACILLLRFRDDSGLTFIERGVSQINSPIAATGLRALSAIGFVQASMLFLWIIPMLIMSLIHVDPFPPLPSYLQNNLCQGNSSSICPN